MGEEVLHCGQVHSTRALREAFLSLPPRGFGCAKLAMSSVWISGQRPPFDELQEWQIGLKFAKQWEPPLEMGFTWSSWVAPSMPHIQQRPPHSAKRADFSAAANSTTMPPGAAW